MDFKEYLSRISPGESVLIEHTSLSAYPLAFYRIGEKYGWDRILLIDVIDSSLIVLRWLRLSGSGVPTNIRRIKVGGVSSWGNVVLDVNPYNDPGIFMSKVTKTVQRLYSKNDFTVALIMNPERLVPLQNGDRSFILALADMASAFLGNPRKVAFYFINGEIADKGYLALLEEAFTRVLAFTEKTKLTVLKSLEIGEEGREIELK
ncbi:hypothetical protein TEU_02855 [Thermococcus eurythermalis]|uniref:DUF835 domain-containing protein n=1 Tax=Thermococcus eurythermalis TaxID=1505907 RepID=A0A097QSB5_9EURY|nr:DUF257 family protein [Thermococcus eurythermalis]AIU69368.1 hypothetical protein TEU_02855 [Thermococcus eurythermalis]